MATNKEVKVSEAASALSDAFYAANHAIADAIGAVQERNMKFARDMFESEVELLKSHAEGIGQLGQGLVELPVKPQEGYRTVADTLVAAEERNIQFVQHAFQSGADVLRANARESRALMQELIEQVQHQQEAAQPLVRKVVEAYGNVIYAPLSYYGKALEKVESISRRGVEAAQNIAQQGVEAVEKAVQPEKEKAAAPK